LERTTASGIEARDMAGGSGGANGADERDRGAFDARQIRHVVIEWLQSFAVGILQNLLEPAFRFAGKK
jgi:hypothetical protein